MELHLATLSTLWSQSFVIYNIYCCLASHLMQERILSPWEIFVRMRKVSAQAWHVLRSKENCWGRLAYCNMKYANRSLALSLLLLIAKSFQRWVVQGKRDVPILCQMFILIIVLTSITNLSSIPRTLWPCRCWLDSIYYWNRCILSHRGRES